jgi:hypothetical protein
MDERHIEVARRAVQLLRDLLIGAVQDHPQQLHLIVSGSNADKRPERDTEQGLISSSVACHK